MPGLEVSATRSRSKGIRNRYGSDVRVDYNPRLPKGQTMFQPEGLKKRDLIKVNSFLNIEKLSEDSENRKKLKESWNRVKTDWKALKKSWKSVRDHNKFVRQATPEQLDSLIAKQDARLPTDEVLADSILNKETN